MDRRGSGAALFAAIDGAFKRAMVIANLAGVIVVAAFLTLVLPIRRTA